MEFLPLISNDSVNLIYIDPPFSELPLKWDHFGEWDFLKTEFERILKHNGQFYISGKQPMLSQVYFSFKDTFTFRFELVWNKNRGLWSSDFKPIQSHELIWCFKKKNCKVTDLFFDIDAIKIKGEPYTRKNKAKFDQRNNWQPRTIVSDGWRFPKTVFNISPVSRRKEKTHPTQKPLEMIEWIVKSSSQIGDLVLDCFMGSGTTAIACIKLKRSFLGCENNKEYFKMSLKRMIQKSISQFI